MYGKGGEDGFEKMEGCLCDISKLCFVIVEFVVEKDGSGLVPLYRQVGGCLVSEVNALATLHFAPCSNVFYGTTALH